MNVLRQGKLVPECFEVPPGTATILGYFEQAPWELTASAMGADCHISVAKTTARGAGMLSARC